MILDYLDRLRRQPYEVRERFALVLTAIVVVAVLILYGGYLLLRVVVFDTAPDGAPPPIQQPYL